MYSRRVLEGGLPVQDNVDEKKEQARAGLRLYGFAQGAERKLWNRLDDVWFLRLEAQEIAWQTRRLLPLLGREDTVARARLAPIGEGVEIMVYTADQAGLFARICGFFARMNYRVLEAKIHTTRDGYALDSFLAMDDGRRDVPYRDILSYIEYELTEEMNQAKPLAEAHHGRLPRQLRSFPLAPEVSLTSGVGDNWLLAVSAGDHPGLLYDVARILARHRVSVQSARMSPWACGWRTALRAAKRQAGAGRQPPGTGTGPAAGAEGRLTLHFLRIPYQREAGQVSTLQRHQSGQSAARSKGTASNGATPAILVGDEIQASPGRPFRLENRNT